MLRYAVPLAAAALLAGCSGAATSREGADETRGKELFQQKCGACHTLADAGTQGDIGPNLDSAFKYADDQGVEDSTFFEVTFRQMGIPGAPMPDYDEKGTKEYLPTGDRISIASYVASVAGKPVKQAVGPNETDAKTIFTGSGCGSCHTLADAGTSGTVGPNLDESDKTLEEALKQITEGGGGMPPYKGRLSDEQIRILARYVTGG